MDSTEPRQSVTTLRGLGNLIKLLPTGTVFFYQLLSPVVSNYGNCHGPTRALTIALVIISGLICFLISFTDSYTGATDGKTHYAIVTPGGLYPKPAHDQLANPKPYSLKFGDLVHAVLATMVFALVVLFDRNSLQCILPWLESTQKTLLEVLSAALGLAVSLGLASSPARRNWFGYPSQRQAPQDVNPPSPTMEQAAH